MATALKAPSNLGQIVDLPIKRIRSFKDQPRKFFHKPALEALAISIQSAGQQVPITVKPISGDAAHDYELVDGQRRWHAISMLKRETIRAWVRHDLEHAEDQFLSSVIANFSREPNNPIEIARAISRLREHPDIKAIKHGDDATAHIGRIFGRGRAWVYQMEGLNRLAPEVQAFMMPDVDDSKRLPYWTAMILAPLPKEKQIEIATKVCQRGMGHKAAHAAIRQLAEPHRPGRPGGASQDRPGVLRESIGRRIGEIERSLDVLCRMTPSDLAKVFAGRPAGDRAGIAARLSAAAAKIETVRGRLTRPAGG
jgi:ParB family transcriptional regulator, chromosome partitioning protein